MSFQRSYSKVWWGSSAKRSLPATTAAGGSFYSYSRQEQTQSHQQQQQQQQLAVSGGNTVSQSLDYNYFKSFAGNLSRIQEVEDEHNISQQQQQHSWDKHDSPGSLRSQDSGFSDNDESQSARSHRASKCHSSPGAKSQSSAQSCDSPASPSASVATPPTVVRRGANKSTFYSPLANVTRRISFDESPDKAANISGEQQQQQRAEQQQQSVAQKQLHFESSDRERCRCATDGGGKKMRRRRRVSRKHSTPLLPDRRLSNTVAKNNNNSSSSCCSSDDDDADAAVDFTAKAIATYNNETVYLGEAPPPYNNETVILGGIYADEAQSGNSEQESPLKQQQPRPLGSTSTPKAGDKTVAAPNYSESPAVAAVAAATAGALQNWVRGLRYCGELEVMSTLQTKSIAAEAHKNFIITTNTVAKLIRQLQQRAQHAQHAFECLERMAGDSDGATLADVYAAAQQLVADIEDIAEALERRAVFFAESRDDRRRYEQHIEQLRMIARDARISLQQQHYISAAALLEDLLLMKRCLLVGLRLVFARLVRVIVQRIEQGHNDLMLRANINMLATLTSDGRSFASLTDAFVQSGAVRALLLVCLEHRVSAVRALALRALATICCAPAAITQLASCGGIEILRDILQVPGAVTVTSADEGNSDANNSDLERREAVSLLTQITAAWHGSQHRVDGLRDCAEAIVEGLTELLTHTGCVQTLLLCAATLNNLSRIEATSHYSIMSHETILKWIATLQRRHEDASIFLNEQIAAMLQNMSLNKKCHSHLANSSVLNFVASIYQLEFYRIYESRAQRDAQRRTIKALLHTLTRLVSVESSLGPELLQLQALPDCLRTALAAMGANGTQTRHAPLPLPLQSQLVENDAEDVQTSIAYKLTRQESYV